jgi:hypothetical protein
MAWSMKKIAGYLKDYFVTVEKRILVSSALFTAIAIFINYYHGLNNFIYTLNDAQQLAGWYFVFLTAFSFPYLLLAAFTSSQIFNNPKFVALLFLAPSLFAWKMSFNTHFSFSVNKFENAYWNHVADWPFKLLVFVIPLLICWKLFDKDQSFYGLNTKSFEAKPYLIMLLIMMPLIAAASTQADFLTVYPKMQSILYEGHHTSGWRKLLFELSYGSDFFSVELFFRGFLVLAFSKWAGRNAILPMACFYCTIHFGKPLGECISSFFGGIILGVVTCHTRSIFGGLMVHLGIAWLMELGGYLGKNL